MDSSGLSILNQRATRLPGPCLLHELVKPASSSPAVDSKSRSECVSLTYQQLHEAADALAARISRCRSKATDSSQSQFVVPVLIHQSPLLYVSLLAVLKAGGAFCPLNIDAPPERVRFILEDVSATVVLVSKDLVSDIPSNVSSTLIVVSESDQEDARIEHSTTTEQTSWEHRTPTADDLAYVMYTSGSTGTPKGVGISHDAATQALLAHDRHIPYFSRFLQFAAPTFDVSVFEIFFPLFRGSTLVSARRADMLNDLPAVLRGMEIDACELTPTVAGSLLRKRENAPGLRLLLTIGEMLSAPVVEEFGGDDAKASILWAMYGPTEATIHCTVQPALASNASASNIGVALDSVSCFIIAPAEPGSSGGEITVLSQGEVGELAVGGYQLATGYINRPEQTGSAFISSPYGRIYRTGDKARLLPDGTLECLGRLSDGQVKLRGQRLELGEVEQVILRTPGCHSVVAMIFSSILVVFCAVDAGVGEDDILKTCRDWLPRFMVPGDVILMEEFPRLPSGKIDRRGLRAAYEESKADWATDSVDSTLVDEVQIQVMALVSEVLDQDVRPSTVLSAAGLDSLKAIKLASILRGSGYHVQSTSLLAMKSVSDIVFAVRSQSSLSQDSTVQILATLRSLKYELLADNPALEGLRELIEDVVPCTPLQSAMLAETARNPTSYCNEIELGVSRGYTAEQVSAALRELFRRNEILRTGFAPWKEGFAAIVFNEAPDDQVVLVDELKTAVDISTVEDCVHPLKIQIQPGSTIAGPRVLVHIHHAIYDGWSMDSLLSDVSELLQGCEIQSRPTFLEVTRFYNSELRPTSDIAKTFWSEYLSGWDKSPRPKLQPRACTSTQICSVNKRLRSTRQAVEAEVQKSGCSAQMLFQASLALLWSGMLGVSDVIIGSVTSGRTIPIAGIERIIGPCIASLPLRVDIGAMTSKSELLNNIQSNNRQSMQHCHLPLSEIQRLLGFHSNQSLYDVLFTYQESLESKKRSGNLVKEVRHLDRLEVPLLFEVEPSGDGFSLQVTYQSSLFPPAMVDQLVQQFDIISSNLLDATTEEDIQASRWAPQSSLSVHNLKFSPFQGVPDLAKGFEQVAIEHPTRTALCFVPSAEERTTTLSYAELNVASNRLAWHLRQIGIEAGQVIAIIMDKSPNLYTAILAVIKSGCAYLPLLPSTPPARVRDIVTQAKAKYCLVDEDSATDISAATSLECVNVEKVPWCSLPTSNLNVSVDPSRLAYVIYTSGTTGVPKGVAVTQRNIVANISDLKRLYPLESRSEPRLLQSCSQAFDVSVFEIFFTWHAGMCLCAGTNDTIFADLEQMIRQLNITHLSLTPTVAALVDPRHVPSVEFLVTAGEPLTMPVLEKFGNLLWQGYGPSETTNICTVKQMSRGDYVEHLGHALSNTSTIVLFPNSLQVVPLGWVGEFCFGGEQVSQGYLNMPNLTTERYIHHPVYGKLHRSGDMGRMLPDGSLVILGRIDDQIKIRGQRVEISEINSVAASLDSVSSAVTLQIRRDEDAAHQLALFYVPQNDAGSFNELQVAPEVHRELLAELQSRLPTYMVPDYLVPVSIVPLLPSGKVDRRRLQAWFQSLGQKYLETVSGTSQESDGQDEWTESENILADVISSFTKSPRRKFGRWTPFALLGIDSISAVELARQIGSRFNLRVAVSVILRNQTIARLARSLTEAPQSQEPSRPAQFFPQSFVTDVVRVFAEDSMNVKEVLPCTPLQEAMLSRGQKNYYNRVLLRFRVEPEVIRSYWTSMAQRHDILRTCFITTTEARRAIAQVVICNWNIPWLTFDVSQPSFDVTIHEHLKTLPDPLDSKIPPLSLAMIKYRSSVFLSFICHHALYDGVAMGNLLREIEDLARGTQLPPPVSYSHFLREALKLPEDVDDFWTAQFHDHRPSTLFPQNRTSEIEQSVHTTSLDLPLLELYKQTRSLGVSLLALCQASWANTLAMAHNRRDICFGNVVSGRTLDVEGLERLVAPCFNTIPIRADLASRSSNINAIRYFHALNTSMMPYQFTPLRRIQPVVNPSGRHLFDTLLLFQNPLQDIDKELWTLEEDSGEMDIPLVCEVVPCPALNSLIVNVHRDMTIVTGETASVMAEVFKLVLKTVLRAPHAPLMDAKSLPIALSSGLDVLQPRFSKLEASLTEPGPEVQWNPIEEQVRHVLANLSGISESRVHRHTTIFELGLDSINAVQIASVLRQKGFDASASDIIEFPSCSQIAAKVMENSESGKAGDIPAYDFDKFSLDVSSQLADKLPESAKIEAVLPCTQVQCAMLAAFIQSKGSYYVNALSCAMNEGIGEEDIKAAWASLQERHPMLRTGFLPVHHQDTSFCMVRYHPSSVKLPLDILEENVAEHTRLSSYRQATADTIRATLRSPPWKVLLVRGSGCVTMHIIMNHALFDAPSLQLMLNDISRQSRRTTTAPLPMVEPALASILRSTTASQDTPKAFWEGKAAQVVVNKFPIMTPLRIDQRAACSDTVMSSLRFSCLRQATRSSNVSIQAVIQAAWTRVLASYLGEDSVVFGVTLSGRTTDATKGSPLPCLNTVPIVASNTCSNNELLAYMMDYNRSLYKHQSSSLSQVQKWLGHPAGSVFDTLLVYQKMESPVEAPPPWKIVEEEAVVEYPVSLEIEPLESDELRLCMTYYNDVLPRKQAQLMIQQFDASLKFIASHPTGHEDDVYATMPNLFSTSPAISTTLQTPVQLLHEFVEQGALLHPTKTALEFASGWDHERPLKQTWSYSELDRMGNRVSSLILGKAAPGSIIAIHFDKCPEAYFSILGILKAGCSFVALDPTAPKARKQFIIQDSEAPCLLTKDPASLDFDVQGALVIVVEVDSLEKMTNSSLVPKPAISPSTTCYCLYTSGTTGSPKGCEITHENAVQAMMAFQELFKGHWEDSSRWLQFAALHFDVSVLEQYWSWSVGITVVAAPKDLILDDLTATINRLKITHIDLTPSLARLTHPDEVPSLCRGVFITGGEQLKQEILDIWGPEAVIYNAYGPTEATIGVTMFQRVPVNGRPSNIGRQFPNVGTYVFRQGTEVPVIRGGVGELCVSGKLVGKGYLNRPELTQERFPFLEEFKERIYRTGDLVRMLHDGCFDFLGRADDQVKLRGQRLEIAEINHAIRTGVDEIQDTATIVTSHSTSGKDVLVSFVVGPQERGKDLRIIQDNIGMGAKAKEACRERLPGYMVPTYVFRLPYIPLSSNNKADVKDLKRLFRKLTHQQLVDLSSAATLPTSSASQETVRRVIGILADFSDLEPQDLTPSTSIFDIGVDSITSLRLSSLLRARGFHAAAPATLLKHPIIADLSNILMKTAVSRNDSYIQEAKQLVQAYNSRYRRVVCQTLGVKHNDFEYIAPCSPLQQGIISRAMTSKYQGTYFNTFNLMLLPHTSVERLRSAWNDLVSTEAILRTVFVSTTEGFVQVALKHQASTWREQAVQSAEMAMEYLQEEKQRWILSNASHITSPLLLTLVISPSCRRLTIHIFHALYDGNSFEIMMERLSSMYHHRYVAHGPSFLETLINGPLWRYDGYRSFWEKHLRGWTFAPIPRLLSETRSTGVTVAREVPIGSFETIRASQNVTLQAVVLAAWTSVLQTDLSQPVTIGVIVSGRAMDLPDVVDTVGPLFNTVPFFSRDLRKETWASLIHRCHEFNTALLEFQHVPLKDIQKWCSGGRALFDNLFTFQIEAQQTGDDPLWEYMGGSSVPDYPLAFEAVQRSNGGLQLTLSAQSHIADAPILQEMLDRLKHTISSMASTPDTLIEQRQRDTGESLAIPQTPSQAESWVEDAYEYQWSDQALQIQHEIALLVNVPAREISEKATLTELGLDSIDIIKLSAKLRRVDMVLPPSQIMRYQNISAMVHELELMPPTKSESTSTDTVLDGIKADLWSYFADSGMNMDNVETILPSTPVQESMVAGMVQSDFETYFNHDIFEISEHVNVDRLCDAWKELVERSPILRTGFFEVDEDQFKMVYCQIVFKAGHSEMPRLELSSLEQAQDTILESKKLASDGGGTSNLVQVRLLTLGTRRLLSLSIAHALYDAWSLDLIFQDLQAAYAGKYSERTYADGFISSILKSNGTEADDFWSQYLEGARPTLLSNKQLTVTKHTDLQRRELDASLKLSTVTEFCKRQSVSLQALCHACWAIVLTQLTGSLDVTFGVTVSGRDFDGAESLLFPTMNTTALRCILHGSPSGFLQYLEETMGDIRQYQHYPLRKAQLSTRTRGTALFDTLFMLQKSPRGSKADKMFRSIDGSSASATEFPICVEAEGVNQKLVWRTACNSRCLPDGVRPEKLLGDLDQIMQFFVAGEEPEMLRFGEEGVSICGMSPIAIHKNHKVQEVAVGNHLEADGTDWSPNASIIREVLSKMSGVPTSSIRTSDTLYNLGLDSISAIRASSTLRKRGIHLRPQDLIKAPSIAEMAGIVQVPKDTSGRPPPRLEMWTPSSDIGTDQLLLELGVTPDHVELLPALPMQVYMLSAWQNAEGSVFYPEFTYVVGTHIDMDTIRMAWRKLVSESPLLRTCFVASGTRDIPFIQVILKEVTIPLEDSRSAGLPSSKLSPLVAAYVTRQKEKGWRFYLKIHHALYDGVSISGLMQRFSELLQCKDETNLDSQASLWRNYTISTIPSNETRRKFWTKYLKDCATRTEKIKSQIDVRARTSYLALSAVPDVHLLQKHAAQHGISFQSLFLAAYARVLAASQPRTGRDVVVFGIYLANRTRDYASPPTYPTLNLVPLKVESAPSRSLLHIAASIQNDIHTVSSPELVDVGLWEISAWTGVKVDTFVNFLSLPDVPDGPEKNVIEPLQVDAAVTPTWDETDRFYAPAWLKNNAVKNDYPLSVDIEASVRESDLDIGIFGSQRRVTDDEARNLVSHIAATLNEINE